MLTNLKGIRLYWEQSGEDGAPVVFVHGSWVDHHAWDAVAPSLSREYRTYIYDRRGHGQSERPNGQGSIREDVADLEALIEANHLVPAHVVGNSFGATICLKLAAARPDLFASLSVHEPPMLALVADDPVAAAMGSKLRPVVEMLVSGKTEQAAREFVESVALGPGEWEKLPREVQQTFVFNAPTFLDEVSEAGPEAFSVDCSRLANFRRPVLITQGGRSPSFYSLIIQRFSAVLPQARHYTFGDAGHIPQTSHPDEFVQVIKEFLQASS